MLTEWLDITELPTQKATQVKNQWGDVVRLVHEKGSVAITNHAKVEMVLVDARTYRDLTKMVQRLKERNREVLDDLNERFEAHLRGLRQPDAQRRVDDLFDADGKRHGKRPVAGASF